MVSPAGRLRKQTARRFKTAEYAAEAALKLAHAANGWVLAEDAVSAFESLLALHDA
jgi:5'-3' exonuclease